jgi:hypothetical protein
MARRLSSGESPGKTTAISVPLRAICLLVTFRSWPRWSSRVILALTVWCPNP